MKQLVIDRDLADGRNSSWDSFDDVGVPDEDGHPTLGEYMEVEDLYVDFFGQLVEIVGGDSLSVAEPTLNMPLPAWLSEFRNGTVFALDQAVALLRCMLRGCPMSCVFEAGGSRAKVRAGFDLQLLVDVSAEDVRRVRETVPGGLQVALEQNSPEVAVEHRVADDDFWNDVHETARRHDEQPWVIERWAYGNWGETWYRPAAGDLSAVRSLLRPNSLVVIDFDPHFQVCRLADYFDRRTIISVDQLGLRYMAQPAEGLDVKVRPLTSRDLEADESLLHRTINLIPAVFWQRKSTHSAVVPDVDGAMRARWLV